MKMAIHRLKFGKTYQKLKRRSNVMTFIFYLLIRLTAEMKSPISG